MTLGKVIDRNVDGIAPQQGKLQARRGGIDGEDGLHGREIVP